MGVLFRQPREWHGPQAQAMLLDALGDWDERDKTGPVLRVLIANAPPFPYTEDSAEEGSALIRAMCRRKPGVELLFIDSPMPFVPEFVLILQYCAKLRWIFINNANLGVQAGVGALLLIGVIGICLLKTPTNGCKRL